MPVAADLVAYLSANHPTDDVSTAGGARQADERPLDDQFAANAVAALVSDDAGDTTQTATVSGRDAANEEVSEAIALNGTTEVTTTQAFEVIHSVVLDAVAAGTVTLAEGAGGTVRHTLAPNELAGRAFFTNAAADPSVQQIRYSKLFWENEGADSLLSAQVQLSADPNANYRQAVAGAVDDTETVADRTTAPSGETFVDDGVDQAVPGTDLAAATAIGVWVEQDLAAAQAADLRETFTTQISGNSGS